MSGIDVPDQHQLLGHTAVPACVQHGTYDCPVADVTTTSVPHKLDTSFTSLYKLSGNPIPPDLHHTSQL